MARVLVYERSLDAILTNFALYGSKNYTEYGVKIKEEPPDPDTQTLDDSPTVNNTDAALTPSQLIDDRIISTQINMKPDSQLSKKHISNKENQSALNINNDKPGHSVNKRKRSEPTETEDSSHKQSRKKQKKDNVNSMLIEDSIAKPNENLRRRSRDCITETSQIHQSKNSYVKCYICHLPISSRKRMSWHLQEYNRPLVQECNICKQKFTRKSRLNAHKSTCPKFIFSRRMRLYCNFCGTGFYLKPTLQSHLFHYHGDEINFNKSVDQTQVNCLKLNPTINDQTQPSVSNSAIDQARSSVFNSIIDQARSSVSNSAIDQARSSVSNSIIDQAQPSVSNNAVNQTESCVPNSATDQLQPSDFDNTFDQKRHSLSNSAANQTQQSGSPKRISSPKNGPALEEPIQVKIENRSPLRKMRQTTLVEFLQLKGKLQKLEPESPEKLSHEETIPSTDTPQRGTTSRDTAKRSFTFYKPLQQPISKHIEIQNFTLSQKTPLVQIHTNPEELKLLLDATSCKIKVEPDNESTSSGAPSSSSEYYNLRRSSTNSQFSLPENRLCYLSPSSKLRASRRQKNRTITFRRTPEEIAMWENNLKKTFKCTECKVILERCDENVSPVGFHESVGRFSQVFLKLETTPINCEGSPAKRTIALKDQEDSTIATDEEDNAAFQLTVLKDHKPWPKRSVDCSDNQNVSCKVCKKKFSCLENVLEHVKLVHVAYLSKICTARFSSRFKLIDHYLRQHAVPKRNECCVCQKTYNNRIILKKHLNVHCVKVLRSQKDCLSIDVETKCNVFRKKYKCNVCSKKFWLSNCLEQHQKTCHQNKTKDYEENSKMPNKDNMPIDPTRLCADKQCDVSDKTSKESQVFRDVNTVCSVCNLMFETYDRFIEHNMYYYIGHVFTCTNCEQTFQSMYMLHHHNKLVHYPEKTRKSYTFICDICNEGFNHESHIHAHMMHVHLNQKSNQPINLRNELEQKGVPKITNDNLMDTKFLSINAYTCEICHLNFTNENDLAMHEVEYSNDGDFQCNVCDKKCFRTSEALSKHQSLNHTGSDIDSSYKCRICGEVVTTSISMACHEKHFHEKSNIKKKDFKRATSNSAVKDTVAQKLLNQDHNLTCTTCRTKFDNEIDLKNHLLEYSDIGEFSCDICHRKFAEKTRMEAHKLKHPKLTGALSENHCPICHERLLNITQVRSHVSHFHGRETFPSIFTGRSKNSNPISHQENKKMKYDPLQANSEKMNNSVQNKVGCANVKPDANVRSNIAFSVVQKGGNKDSMNNPSSAVSGYSTVQSCNSNLPSRQIQAQEVFNCSTCNIIFSSRDHLAKHKARYSNNGDCMCEICGRNFPWETFFQEHYQKHFRTTSSNFLKYKCHDCTEMFRTRICAIAHNFHIHPKKDDEITKLNFEEICVDESKQKKDSNLIKGLNVTEESECHDAIFLFDLLDSSSILKTPNGIIEKSFRIKVPILLKKPNVDAETHRYSCPLCVVEYRTLKDFHRHFRQTHPKSMKVSEDIPGPTNSHVVICLICKSTFATQQKLNNHLKAAHPSESQSINARNKGHINFVQSNVVKTQNINSNKTLKPISGNNDNNIAKTIREKRKATKLPPTLEDGCSKIHSSDVQRINKDHSYPVNNKKLKALAAKKATGVDDTKVGKLKVRSFAKIIENLSRNCELKSNVNVSNYEMVNHSPETYARPLNSRTNSELGQRHNCYLSIAEKIHRNSFSKPS